MISLVLTPEALQAFARLLAGLRLKDDELARIDQALDAYEQNGEEK